jgi:cysteinyl-tRNA synthetase
MDNDFNTALAIADFSQYITILNKILSEKKYQEALDLKTAMKKVYSVIGICQMNPVQVIKQTRDKYLEKSGMTEEEISKLLEQRKKYKLEKNYSAADEIRNHLISHSIEVKDDKENAEWDLII